MAQASRTFRVFVSSTFNDLNAERNALQERVYPRLKALCAQYGSRFQAIDLRWGVSEEAGLDQQTMNICLGEIARCQKTSPRPNFIILLGDRYGWCPLPSQIPADEFDQIYQHTMNTQDRALLDMWYKLDKNAVPPEYVLQPRFGELEEYRDQDLWNEVESRLRQILHAGVEQIALPADAKLKYSASATEQEVFDGAFKVVDAKEHVFGFFRHIEALPVTEKTKDFQNLFQVGDAWQRDQLAQDKLVGLKANLRQTLPPNITEYSVEWDNETQLPDLKHLDRLCEDVYNRLGKVILAEIEQLEQVEPLDREIHAHQAFAKERARIFIGRETILEKIDGYISRDQAHPLAIWGESGTGKSALMAKAVQEAQLSHHEANLVYRFVGITPDASNGRSLLESLCRQITHIYGGDLSTIPTAFDELVHELPNRFGLVKTEKPLILFIDALNQLSDADNAKDLDWLPSVLPPGVHIIVSTIPGICLDALKNKLGVEDLLELSGLSTADGAKILKKWLDESHRELQTEQKSHLLGQFSIEGSPLYLRLAFEEVRRWKSYDGLPCGADKIHGLSPDIPGILKDLFWRLSQETNHGQLMVSRSLEYLAAARYGLSEDEMLDILSIDEAVGQDFLRRSPRSPGFTRLPVVIWSRLYYELAPYMTEIDADGISLLSFYHPQLAQVVVEVFLPGVKKEKSHHLLAQYFEDLPLFMEHDRTPNLRKLSELPWQLAQFSAWQDLSALLQNLPFFGELWKKDPYEVKTYWAQIETNASLRLVDAYHPVIETPERYPDQVWSIATLLHETGYPEQALKLRDFLVDHYRKTGDRANLQAALGNQAVILNTRGDPEGAMALLKEQERLCYELGDKEGLSASLGNQALIVEDWGDLEAAMALHKKEEHLSRELGNKDGVQRSLGNQALILRKRGHLEGAMALQKERERLCRELGDKQGIATSLHNQGGILYASGEWEGAMALYREAERLLRELGNKEGVQRALGSQAMILKARGDLDGAMALLKEQERICRELGHKEGLSISLGSQAMILKARGDMDGSMALLKEQERLLRELGNKQGIATSLSNQANILRSRRNLGAAMSLHKEAEGLWREMGNKEGLQATIGGQANILLDQGDPEGAMALYVEQERLCREMGHKDGLQIALGNEGTILYARNDLERAMALFEEKESLCRELGNKQGLAMALGNQGVVLADTGMPDRGLALTDEAYRLAGECGLTSLQQSIESMRGYIRGKLR